VYIHVGFTVWLIEGIYIYRCMYCIYIMYTYMTVNARWRSRRSRSKAAVHVPDFDILVPALELSLPIQFCRHISKRIIFFASTSDSSGAGTRVSKFGTWMAALERERRLLHLAFTVRYIYLCIYICIYTHITYIYVYI